MAGLMRVLAYDEALAERSGRSVVVGVLAVPHDASPATALVRATFGRLTTLTLQGLPVQVVDIELGTIEGLGPALQQARVNVLFLCGGLDARVADIVRAAHELHVPTMTQQADYVRLGVAFALAPAADGKPRLLVNLGASRSVGMRLRADLLRLAQLVD
ncbi:MAG: YfiR family protein [Myxococcota bacterium]